MRKHRSVLVRYLPPELFNIRTQRRVDSPIEFHKGGVVLNVLDLAHSPHPKGIMKTRLRLLQCTTISRIEVLEVDWVGLTHIHAEHHKGEGCNGLNLVHSPHQSIVKVITPRRVVTVVTRGAVQCLIEEASDAPSLAHFLPQDIVTIQDETC